jgi:hypothetical protein
MQRRAQASGDPGDHTGWGWQGQSRALPTPIWRLGVQCKRSIRDSTDLQR